MTLGQCKCNLRAMSKTSKLCQFVCRLTRLDGTTVLILLCGYSGSKGNYHKPKQCFVQKKNVSYISRHRLGYFRTPTAWESGGVGSDLPPPCYLEKQWSYRASRGGVRKLCKIYEFFPKHTYDFKTDLKFRVKVRSKVKFWRSVWWSLRPAISIAFARNSPKVTSKGYWRYPVSMSVILSTGQGQGQVTKVQERSPNSKNYFSCIRLIISRHLCT